MNEGDTVESVFKRIEACEGARTGRSAVKGTLVLDGTEVVRSSFDNTTSSMLIRHTDELKRICENFVRELDAADKLEYVRSEYKDLQSKDARYQLMMAVDGDFRGVVLQEHKARNLRERVTKDRDPKGFKYLQKDLFFPSLDK